MAGGQLIAVTSEDARASGGYYLLLIKIYHLFYFFTNRIVWLEYMPIWDYILIDRQYILIQ